LVWVVVGVSKRGFAVFVGVVGLYEVCVGVLFFVATRFLTTMVGFVPNLWTTSLGQHFGGALIAFGMLGVVSARDLDRWLVIPIMAAVGRILSFSVMMYYTAIGALPLLLILPFIVIDGATAFLVLLIIWVSNDYSYRKAFGI
jgi:hypothetical protein